MSDNKKPSRPYGETVEKPKHFLNDPGEALGFVLLGGLYPVLKVFEDEKVVVKVETPNGTFTGQGSDVNQARAEALEKAAKASRNS